MTWFPPHIPENTEDRDWYERNRCGNEWFCQQEQEDDMSLEDNAVEPTDLKKSLVTIRAGFRGIAWNLRHIDDPAMGISLGLTPEHMAAFKLFGDWFEKQFEAVGDAIQHLIEGLEE